MKMFYGSTPIKSLNIKHYEMDTNSCDMIASDLQAGKTAVARGQKITGTGKSFEFANYGQFETNSSRYIPSNINIIEVSSTVYPIKVITPLLNMHTIDFSTGVNVGIVSIDGSDYNLIATSNNNLLEISCEQTFTLQVFYGKDNYVL